MSSGPAPELLTWDGALLSLGVGNQVNCYSALLFGNKAALGLNGKLQNLKKNSISLLKQTLNNCRVLSSRHLLEDERDSIESLGLYSEGAFSLVGK